MSNKTILAAMATLSLLSCTSKETSKYAQDTFKADDGTSITFTYYGHASIGIEPFDRISVEAVPAYNISPEQLAFHPKERGDAGYIITIAGKRIYVSGDTEDNEGKPNST